jgi:hypothetical protein
MDRTKKPQSPEGKCCPSSADNSVRYVIGRRREDGTTQFAKELVPAGPEVTEYIRFVNDDYAYRFGGVCMQGDCRHWAGGCELGASVTKVAIEKKLNPRDPCAFKILCRWFAENGAAACGGCTYVSRAIGSTDDERDPYLKTGDRGQSDEEVFYLHM